MSRKDEHGSLVVVPASAQLPTGHRRYRVRRLAPVALLLPAMLLLGAIFLMPTAGVLLRSITADQGISLDKYLSLFTNQDLLQAFITTVWLTAATVLIALVVGFPIAYTLAKVPPRLAVLLLVLVLVPLWTSTIAKTFAFLVILGRQGILNVALQGTGIIDEPLSLLFSPFSVVLALVHIGLPVMVLPLYAALRQIDPSFVTAAASLGASPTRALREVVIPLAMPGAAAGCTLVYVTTIGAYVIPALLGGRGETMLAQHIFAEVRTFNDLPTASGMTVGLLLLASFGLILMNRFVGLGRLWETRGRVA
jgi:putative spermidine/putrescine transport system permease protein